MVEVSVIVPVYKVEKYLRRCIESILSQTFSEFELLLIDDGSPDSSGVICDEYAQRDSRVRAFHKTNGGVSSARNLGLDHAQGKYIMFCDSDDYVAETWIEKLYALMTTENVDLGICGFYLVKSEGGEIVGTAQYNSENQVLAGGEILWELKEKSLLHVLWNKIFKSCVIKHAKLRFEEGLQLAEDELFVLAYLYDTKYRFGITNDFLNYYRCDVAGSLTHKCLPNAWEISKRVIEEERKALEFCHIELENISNSFYSAWVWCVAHSIQNNMMKERKFSFFEMMKMNHIILNSSEAREAFEKSECRAVTPLYKNILKTRSALIVWLFHCAVRMKYAICRT